MQRCSILHFTNSTLWGGVEEHICSLLRSLSCRFCPQLVCDPSLYERFRAAISEDVRITPLALSSPRHVSAAVRFARLLRCGQFDIVHSHMFWSSLFASPIAWACRVPTVIETLHGTEAWRTGWKASCTIDRATTRFVSKYVAVCASDAQFLEEKKQVPRHKIAVIPNGVDVRRFLVSSSDRHASRSQLGLGQADLVVIVVARLHRGKGHAVLLDAIGPLLPVHPALKVIFLGEGEEGRELEARANALGLRDCVRLLGYQNNVQEWLAAADINVLPTFYEGLPLTVLEAMASGLPTVASNVGGIPDAIEHGVSGLLVPPGDPTQLRDAISCLLQDPCLRTRLGKVAQRRALESFDFEQQVRRTEKLYVEMSDILTQFAQDGSAESGEVPSLSLALNHAAESSPSYARSQQGRP